MNTSPNTGGEPLLNLEDLWVEYRGISIVRGISLTVAPGEIFGIVGESGSGKSTLLGAILGMLGQEGRISGGHIYFEGKDLGTYKKEEMRRLRGERLGAVFQNPGETLNPSRHIDTQFYEALKAHRRITRREAAALAAEMMGRLHLEHGEALLKKYPFQLSGGMNQRVALALAMVMQPSLLLADEPTSALDVTVQAQAIDELMQLRDKFGTAILLVTHNLGVLAHMADRVAVMYAGQVVEYGDKRRVLRRPAHPYTRALLAAIPDFSGQLPRGLPGAPPPFGKAMAGCAFRERCPYATDACRERELRMRLVEEDHYTVCLAEEEA